MAKRSHIQIALDKIDAEIYELTRVRERLVDALELNKSAKPKAPRKAKAKVVVADSGV